MKVRMKGWGLPKMWNLHVSCPPYRDGNLQEWEENGYSSDNDTWWSEEAGEGAKYGYATT